MDASLRGTEARPAVRVWANIRHNRLAPAAALVCASLLVAAATWPMLSTGRVPIVGDLINALYPQYDLLGRVLASGRLPVWSPYSMAGIPLLGDLQTGWGTPAMLPFTFLPLQPAALVMIVGYTWLAAVGALLFLRATGSSWAASTATGVAYALLGPVLGIVIDVAFYNPTYIGTYVALPWLLLGVRLAVRHPRWRLLGWSVAAVACMEAVDAWLGQGAYYVILAGGAYLVFLVLLSDPAKRLPERLRELAVHMLALAVLSVGFSAWALLPRLQYILVSDLRGGYGEGQQQFVGGVGPGFISVFLQPGQAYLGGGLLLLLLLASIRPSKEDLFYAGAAIITFLSSLSYLTAAATSSSLARSILHLVPGFLELHLHNPERIMFVPAFFLIVLGGRAIDRVPMNRWSLVVVPAVAVVLLACVSLNLIVSTDILPLAAAIIIAGGLVLLAWTGKVTSGVASLALSVLVVAEVLLNVHMAYDRHPAKIHLGDVSRYYNAPEVEASVRLIQSLPPGRYYGYDPAILRHVGYRKYMDYPKVRALLASAQASMYGLEDIQAYNPVHLAVYNQLLLTANGSDEQAYHQNYRSAYVLPRAITSPLIDILNARYVLTSRRLKLPSQYRLIGRTPWVRLYRNDAALPRAWITHSVTVLSDVDALQAIDQRRVDPRTTAILERPVIVEPRRRAEDVRITAYELNRIELSAALSAPGIVISSEMYYPSWKVRVDGKPAQALKVDGALRGVLIPAGRHEITWYYDERLVWMGIVISLLTAVVMAVLITLPRRYSRWISSPSASTSG